MCRFFKTTDAYDYEQTVCVRTEIADYYFYRLFINFV